MKKNFFASKINWAGIALVGYPIVTQIIEVLLNQDVVKENPGLTRALMGALGVLVVLFRTYSNTPPVAGPVASFTQAK